MLFINILDINKLKNTGQKVGKYASRGKLFSIFASAKEVMFLPDFVCLSVC